LMWNTTSQVTVDGVVAKLDISSKTNGMISRKKYLLASQCCQTFFFFFFECVSFIARLKCHIRKTITAWVCTST
jgi:hypothetical protein